MGPMPFRHIGQGHAAAIIGTHKIGATGSLDALVRFGMDRNHARDGAGRRQRERLSWLFWSGHTDDFCVSRTPRYGLIPQQEHLRSGSPRCVCQRGQDKTECYNASAPHGTGQLFVAKRDDWINTRGALRGNDAGQEGDQEQSDSRGGVHGGSSRPDPIQQRLKQAAKHEREA